VAPSVKDAVLAALIIHPLTADRIKAAQENDLGLQQLMEKASQGKAPGFHFTNDDLFRTGDARVAIPNVAELRKYILNEAHKTRYTVHSRNTKMYQDLKKEKLSPRYVGPFIVTEVLGPVTYRVELPSNLAGVHDVFHVSTLRKIRARPVTRNRL
jgi:hypothetical protein